MSLENPLRVVSPLDMDAAAYDHWREQKLRLDKRNWLISLADGEVLSGVERQKIRASVAANNFAVLQTGGSWQLACEQLGLTDWVGNPESNQDGVTAIAVAQEGSKQRYIPYSNQSLRWHTDGYYNDVNQIVRSFALYCVRAAGRGGENRLLDPELAYIALRDQSPAWIKALCHPETFVIPENRIDGEVVRKEFCGSVFATDSVTGRLYMRYTQRRRNIVWREDAVLHKALEYLNQLLDGDSKMITTVRLEPEQLLLCNNVLHCRSGFIDEKNGRLLYRMRFRDIIAA